MCGIAGIAGTKVNRLANQVQQMTDAIAHRGPDDQGHAIFEHCIIGQRRLSIVDLATGHQPMHSPFGTSIVFNGEFYGYKPIRAQTAYPYQTNSDTELILALYHQYPLQEFVTHVKGMFAFALWDEKEQQLIAARDRFGEKPFYYTLTDQGELIFASEIKAILASGLIEPVINPEALTHYLQHLYVHPHHSIYKNIQVLPPAHYLIFKNGQLRIERYWQLPQQQLKITAQEAKEECYRLLSKAVQDQMVADVTVGSFLSGGLDSSTITALAAMSSSQPLTTISFSFGDNNSELPFSRQIAEKYATNSIELHQDDYDIAHWFEQMIGIYDEPFADSSNIPTYLISQMAAEKLKVVLTGDGGDELMAGYTSWYQSLYRMQHPEGIKDRLQNVTKKILHPQYRHTDIASIHLQRNRFFGDDELKALCRFEPGYRFNKFIQQPFNTVDAAMRMDLQDYMPGDILVKTDRAAMANSLELRAPFLDVNFAEFCIALPESLKLNGTQDKVLLRESFGHLWTPEIATRRKQGFGAPVAAWLQQKGMVQLKQDYINNKNNPLYQWLDYNQCQAFINKNNYQSWIILTLAVWMTNR
jgi:asparagine synthase (glutamine-hydrolysing)